MRLRFSLRTLFVLVALTSIPMGWVAYQLNWIRQRHDFLLKYEVRIGYEGFFGNLLECPWQLKLLGERTRNRITVMKDQVKEAIRLFPEAQIYEQDDTRESPLRADPGNPPNFAEIFRQSYSNLFVDHQSALRK